MLNVVRSIAIIADARTGFFQLDMMGYDMSWASFNVVEVMSSSRIHLKSIGYLGAVQSFKEDTDVLMLTTNTLKKVRLITL